MSPGAAYEVEHSPSSLESLEELDPSLQPVVNTLLGELGAYAEKYPYRTHLADDGTTVYHHPNPDIEIAYYLDKEHRKLTCVHVAAPLPRRIAFVSYSHKDKKQLEEFRKYMLTLQEQGRIQFWDDGEIEAGADWEADLLSALHSAQAAVLLVSQDFLFSEYIRTKELPALQERFDAKRVVVYWIPLEHSTYEDFWFGRLQALCCDPKTPLSTLRKSQRQKKLTEISRELKRRLIG